MDKMRDLSEMKHILIDAVKNELASGVHNVSAEQLGLVVDMIKDLASAEKDCMEAAYYGEAAEAMGEGEERMGYDRWRYSSGRFAPKGRGRVSGYLPTVPEMDGLEEARNAPVRGGGVYGDRRMGYSGSVDEIAESMGEIWDGATREDREKMKRTLRDILGQMEQAE